MKIFRLFKCKNCNLFTFSGISHLLKSLWLEFWSFSAGNALKLRFPDWKFWISLKFQHFCLKFSISSWNWMKNCRIPYQIYSKCQFSVWNFKICRILESKILKFLLNQDSDSIFSMPENFSISSWKSLEFQPKWLQNDWNVRRRRNMTFSSQKCWKFC